MEGWSFIGWYLEEDALVMMELAKEISVSLHMGEDATLRIQGYDHIEKYRDVWVHESVKDLSRFLQYYYTIRKSLPIEKEAD